MSAQHLYQYALQVLMWAIYLNGSYSISQFYLFIGLAPPHHNIRYTILLLAECNIMYKKTHDNGKDIYGLAYTVKQYISSEEAPLDRVDVLLKAGHSTIKTRNLI